MAKELHAPIVALPFIREFTSFVNPEWRDT